MKLITTNSGLRTNLARLIKKYPNVAFAVAWASAGTDVFNELKKNRWNIHKAVIGTHFYQTHPDVLDVFVDSEKVRFMLQPKGVFHPKVYLFWDKREWELLIGSANLTAGAMNQNSEVMTLISSTSSDAAPLKDEIIALIDGYFSDARTVGAEDAAAYRALWQKQQPVLHRLSGQYGKDTNNKSPVDSNVMAMTWEKFVAAVRNDPYHGFENRCDLLKLVRDAFGRIGQFQLMDRGLRKTIAGLPNDVDSRWGWFGSMKGAGYYHQAVNDNSPHLSQALDQIPLTGQVSRQHYDAYLAEFLRAFPNGRHGIGIASRLLALKRPDYFVCIDSKNKQRLCQDFGIKQTGLDYERYWDEVIERITDSVWWNEPRPVNPVEAAVWDGRAAMLDAIFYEE